MTEEELEMAWRETAAQAGMPLPNAQAMFRGLCSMYSRPDRVYHTLDHVAAMLDIVSRFAGLLHEPLEVRLAVWFHDYVYDARRKDNEEQSALYATVILDGEQWALIRPRLTELILATKTHRARWGDTDCQLLLDADLAVLGTSEAEYDGYARAIREEYAWVPDEEYRTGRRQVLEGFLERERIYQTAPLFQAWEAPARRNLWREIERLSP